MRKESDRKKPGADDFIRYRSGRLKGRERNAFEKFLQKDPFAEEAAEGFSQIEAEEAAGDLKNLDRRLAARTRKKRTGLLLRIAASVAVIICAGSVILLITTRNAGKRGITLAERPVALDNEPVMSRDSIIKPLNEHSVATSVKRSVKKNANEAIPAAPEPVQDKLILSEPAGVQEYLVASDSETRKELVPVKAGAMQRKAAGTFKVEGRVISADDSSGIPGASVVPEGKTSGVFTDSNGYFSLSLPDSAGSILTASYIGMKSREFTASPSSESIIALNSDVSALSEVVVTAYGTRRGGEPESETSDRPYLSPRPAGGRKDFENYIREHLRQPDTVIASRKAVVIVSILVRTNGSLDSLEIVKSPGKLFSDEAIRLIKEGPDWLPAEDNGKAVSDRVRVRIVFR